MSSAVRSVSSSDEPEPGVTRTATPTGAEPTAAAASPGSIFAPQLRTATAGLLILITMIAFEAMAVGPALPTAARELHGVGAYGWAFTAFLVANVVGMVVAGQLSDSRGPRRPLTAGMALFVAGLLVAGSAATMVQLVLARAVQGLGGGLLITAAYVVIGETYPDLLRPKVFAATSSAWLLPSLLGPVVSGTVTQHVGWRWVFLGLVPFVLAGALLMLSVLRRLPLRPRAAGAGAGPALGEPRRLGFALLVALGVAVFEFAGAHPSVGVDLAAVAGVVLVALALRGLVPPGTYRARPGVAAPVALRGLLAGAFFGAESTVPLLLTTQHGLGATLSGLPLACAGIVWAVGSWWQGRAVGGDREARRVRLVRAGFCCIAVSVGSVALVALPATPWWLIFAGWACGGLGCGLAMASVSVLLLDATTDADRGRDSAALQLADTTGSAVTTGLAGILVAAAARGSLSYTTGFVAANLAFVAVALLGAVIAGRARPAAPATATASHDRGAARA